MKQDSPNNHQMSFMAADLLDQLNPKHPLLQLAKNIPWDYFEAEFSALYSALGRPAKPIRLMVGLCILKHMENLSDERVVRLWVQIRIIKPSVARLSFNGRCLATPRI